MRLLSSPGPEIRPRVLVINPNSTEAFTEAMHSALEVPGIALDFYTAPLAAPASIEGSADSVASAAECLRELRECIDNWDGFVVACFSNHPLTQALRELTAGPVTSILEASLLCAAPLGTRVGILTTSPRWEPLLAHDVAALHLSAHNAAGIVSSGLSVLDLERLPRPQVLARLCEGAREELQARRGADVLVLGCAGMVGLDAAIRAACRPGTVVLDPVRCGVEFCAALLRMHAGTSKTGIYARA